MLPPLWRQVDPPLQQGRRVSLVLGCRPGKISETGAPVRPRATVSTPTAPRQQQKQRSAPRVLPPTLHPPHERRACRLRLLGPPMGRLFGAAAAVCHARAGGVVFRKRHARGRGPAAGAPVHPGRPSGCCRGPVTGLLLRVPSGQTQGLQDGGLWSPPARAVPPEPAERFALVRVP